MRRSLAGRLRRPPDSVAQGIAAIDRSPTIVPTTAVELIHPVASEYHPVLAGPIEPQPKLFPDPRADDHLAQLVEKGQLKYSTDIRNGLEECPRGLKDLLEGNNKGKVLIRISSPSTPAHL